MFLLNPRVDLAFKKIFGIEENKDLLISFINSIVSIEDQVVDIELLNPYNSRNFAGDKGSILDIKAKDSLGNYFNIEVQISNDGDYNKRALLYWAKLYTDQLGAGDSFHELRKAIGIHVLNFTSVPNNPKYCNKFIITEEETKERHFHDLAIYTVELDKFDRYPTKNLEELLPHIKSALDRWAAFLTRASKLDRNNLPKELDDPCIKKAFDVLTQVSLNKEERELYEGHLKWMRIEASTLKKAKEEAEAEGLAKGLAKGLAEGEAKRLFEKQEIAKKLLLQGMSIDIVSQVTGLSKKELL